MTKHLIAALVATASLLAPGHFAVAQKPSPEPGPKPTAAPAATPAATPAPTPAFKPKPVAPATAGPSPARTMRELIDSLGEADLKQLITLLKSNYVNQDALNDEEMARATAQGLLDRIAPGASISNASPAGPEEPGPFRAEILDDRIGYLRLGALSKNNIDEMDAALKNFAAKSLKSAILDLRATTAASDFEQAAEAVKRFSPKGKMLFSIKKPSAKQERIFTSNQDRLFQGLLVIVVNKDTSGAGEVLAAVLRIYARALIVGEQTAGRAVEYADLPLQSGTILRVAVAEIALPENVSVFPKGLKPDLVVAVPENVERELLKSELEKGVSQFVFETERPRMNEASLVAGTNPELDALEAAQNNKSGAKPKSFQRDVALQRAVDLITTISVYESNPPHGDK